MRIESSHVSGLLALSAVVCLAGCSGGSSAAKPPAAARPPEATFDKSKKTTSLSTGVTMTYVEAGKAGSPVVIMLHGFTDTSRSFFPTIEAMLQSAPDLHVYALDARGHGGSSMPKDEGCAAKPEQCFEMADFAADVVAFMDQKKIRKAHLVGASMGSLVAQEIALASPDRVESVMLIGTFVTGVSHPVIHQFLVPLLEDTWKKALAQRQGFQWPQDAYLLTPRDADTKADAWMAQNWVVDPVASPEFLAEIVPDAATTKLGTWIGAVRNFAKFDNRERLKKLKVRTLVIWATQDNLFPMEPDQTGVRAALDGAVTACQTSYFFKTYGKQPLPASGAPESDLGHNTQWGAPGAMAADIVAWVEIGAPTTDLPYADPTDVHKVAVAQGAAQVVEKRPAPDCKPAAP
jgi:non-heme chloroperoxidase